MTRFLWGMAAASAAVMLAGCSASGTPIIVGGQTGGVVPATRDRPGENPGVLAFGTQHTYRTGVRQVVAPPRTFTPRGWDRPDFTGMRPVRVTVRITNGSGALFTPSAEVTAATGRQCREAWIGDPPPSTPLPPGRSVTYEVSFACVGRPGSPLTVAATPQVVALNSPVYAGVLP